MTIVYTPWRRNQVIALSGGKHRWRKQLLPLDKITYKGETVDFTANYLKGLVRAFKEKAIDVVPFQLAGADNKHTNAVKARQGTITELEFTGDGLDVILETDDEGDELLSKYPDIGVSARIYEDYEREADGKHWPAALQHVLATLDPHITGMRPWERLEPVSLSNSHGRIIDLTAERFDQGEEELVPKTRSSLKEILAKIRDSGDDADLTDDELDELLKITEAVSGKSDDDSESNELTDEELDAILTAAGGLTDEEDGDTSSSSDSTVIAASRQNSALELANARLETQAIELAGVQRRLDDEAWAREKLELANRHGIPPFVTEKAKPLLYGSDHVVELSNGEEVDAGGVMRDVLHTIGKQIKLLDLSTLIGNGLPPDDDEAAAEQKRTSEERDEFLKNAKLAFRF